MLSNVGYVGPFIPVLLGYYFLRKWRPEVFRPFKLPEWMKYGAVALAIVYAIVWLIGIPACAIEGCQLGGGKRIQFRWEAYNVFNQVNWSALNTNAQFNPAGQQVNASFGQATASRSARVMQGAIRFSF